MKSLSISQEAAREIVEFGLDRPLVSVQDPPSPTFDDALGPDIRLARLQSSWTRNAAGVWQATARFVVGDPGVVDSSFTFPIYAPSASERPQGTPGAGGARFYAIWRGRWESLQTVPHIATYGAGTGISVYTPTTSSTTDYTIENAGLVSAKVPGESFSASGTLLFSPRYFTWGSTTSSVGSKELCIKTTPRRVVTDVSLDENGNLNVTTDTIAAVG